MLLLRAGTTCYFPITINLIPKYPFNLEVTYGKDSSGI